MRPTFSSVPALVDRKEEVGRIAAALEDASKGRGQLILFRGEGGCGKTRLVQEAARMAEGRGFAVGFGTGLAESVTPYAPWRESLSPLGLAHVLDDLPPPKLLGLYLFTRDHRLVATAEREALPDALVSAVTDVVHDPTKRTGITVEGPLAMCSFESHRILVHRADGFAAAAIVQGVEDEGLLADLRELAVTAGSSGGPGSTTKSDASEPLFEESPQRLLDSGRYEGIDYVKDDPKLRQQRLFDRAAMALVRKAETRPIILAFDDLQWADSSSLALLHYVARNTRQSQTLILGSYRVEETEVRPHLKEALQRMDKEKLLAEIPLTGLVREEMDRLAESFLGAHALTEELLDLLWRETQGYPLFVREVLRQLEDEKAIDTKGAVKRLIRPLEQLSIPHRVREVIRARIDRLPKDDRELLEAAATCGTRFTATFVAKVTGEEEGSISPALENLARIHGLLRQTENGFAFNHPVVKEVVYDGIPSGAKQALHRDAAEWLELVGGPIEDIAEHYYRARDPRALPRLKDAAETALARYASGESVRLYGEALELAEEGERPDLLRRLGHACVLTGAPKEGLGHLESALKLAKTTDEKVGLLTEMASIKEDYQDEYDEALRLCQEVLELDSDSRHRGRALAVAGSAYRCKGDAEKAQESCEKCRAIAEGIGDRKLLSESLYQLAASCVEKGAFTKAAEYAETGLAVASQMGDEKLISKTSNALGVTLFKQGRVDKALEHWTRSLEAARKVGELKEIATATGNIGNVHNARGDHKKAISFYEEAVRVMMRIGERRIAALNLFNAGESYLTLGEMDKALACLQESLGLRELIGERRYICLSLTAVGGLLLARGDLESSRQYLERATEMAEDLGDWERLIPTLIMMGWLEMELGRHDTALGLFDRSRRVAEEIAHQEVAHQAWLGLAIINLESGDPECALQMAEKGLDLMQKTGLECCLPLAQRIFGMIHRNRREWMEAINAFQENIQYCEGKGMEYDLADAHFEFGLMWKKRGDTDKAKEHLGKALRIFERLKRLGYADKTRKAIAGLGSQRLSSLRREEGGADSPR